MSAAWPWARVALISSAVSVAHTGNPRPPPRFGRTDRSNSPAAVTSSPIPAPPATHVGVVRGTSLATVHAPASSAPMNASNSEALLSVRAISAFTSA